MSALPARNRGVTGDDRSCPPRAARRRQPRVRAAPRRAPRARPEDHPPRRLDGDRAQRLEGRGRAGRLGARRGPGTPGGPTDSGRGAGAPSGGAGTAGRAGTHVTAAPPVPASAGGGAGRQGRARGRTWRASGLPRNLSSCCGSRLRTCSTFAMFLSGGAPLPGRPPERSPEAGGVNAAPPLNSERGGRPGRGRGSSTGCARGGGRGLRGAGAGAEGEGEAAVPGERTARTHAATHARTHAAGWPAGPCARSGGGKLRARSPSRRCAQARRGRRAGLPSGRGRGVMQVWRRGRPGCSEVRTVISKVIYSGPMGTNHCVKCFSQ